MLDISKVDGKRQKLQTYILKEVAKRLDNLPNLLVMTQEQYELLKKTKEFGDKNECYTCKPSDRIYCTEHNAFEIKIKKLKWYEKLWKLILNSHRFTK